MIPPQGLKLSHREMLKKSSQEPLGQFQPNLAENMPGGWGSRFIQIRGKIRTILINLLLMNHILAGIH